MVTPGAHVRLHRIRNDRLYHYYLGDPIEVLMLHADGTSDWQQVVRFSSPLATLHWVHGLAHQ